MEGKRADIERLSSDLEKEGFSPVGARVYVYLLFSGENGAEFDDVVTFFNVSKSAVSNALSYLQSKGFVDFKTIGGQRKRNFFVIVDGVSQETSSIMKLERLAKFFTELKTARGIEDEFGDQLENVALLCRMFSAEIPIIIERWKNLIAENKKAHN